MSLHINALKVCLGLAAFTLGLSAGPGLHATDPAPAIVKYANGFETPQERTFPDGQVKGAVSIDTTQAHGGKASLKIARKDEGQELSWRSKTIDVKAGEIYRFSAWMKFEKVIMPDPSYSPEAHVIFLNSASAAIGEESFADSWKFVREDGAVGFNIQSCDWTYHEKLIKAPPGAVAAVVLFTLNKTVGTAWLDDIRVTDEPDTLMPGDAAKAGFLTLWPARAGEKGSLHGGSFFDPGEPIDWFVKAPERADATKPSVVSWKIRDSLDRPVDSGNADVVAGTALPKVSLPNLDAQKARWLRCDWTWSQDGKILANRVTSILVLPKINPYSGEHFGMAFQDWDIATFHRLGIDTARCDSWWRDHEAPTPDSPNQWNGRNFQLATEANIQVLCLLHYQGPKWAYLRPNEPHIYNDGWASQPDALKKLVIDVVTKFKSNVRYWQLGNEVSYRTDERRHDYETDAKALYEGVKETDPTAQVLLGSQGGGLDDVEKAAKEGLLNSCDIYDCHYQSVSSLRDIRAFLDRMSPKRHIPIWETECGEFDLVPDDIYASNFIQIMASNVGEGVDRSFWCTLGSGSGGDEREANPPDHTGSNYLSDNMPGQMVASHVLCTEFFGDALPVKPLDNDRCRGYLFHKGKTWSAVVWAEGQDPLPGQLVGIGTHVKIADWTGRHAEIDTVNGSLPLNCSNRPWLVQWEADDGSKVAFQPTPVLAVQSEDSHLLYTGTKNELTVSVPAGAAPLKVNLDAGPGVTITPATLDLKPGESQKITLDVPVDSVASRLTLDARTPNGWLAWEYRLKPALAVSLEMDPRSNRLDSPANRQAAWLLSFENNGSGPVTAKIDLSSMATTKPRPEQLETTVEVPAHEKKEVRMPLSVIPAYTEKYGAKADLSLSNGQAYTIERDAGFLGATRFTQPVKIDGSMDNWKGIEPVVLDKGKDYFRFSNVPGTWGGPEDLSARFYFAWDPDNIYFAAIVRDNIHCNDQPLDTVYMGDSIELALQPVIDGQNQSFTKFLIALNRGKNFILALKHGDTGFDSSTVEYTVRRDEAKKNTYYEARIPWAAFAGAFKPAVGAHLRTAVLLDENDGKGRAAFMQWFGLLSNPTRGEKIFTDLTLTK